MAKELNLDILSEQWLSELVMDDDDDYNDIFNQCREMDNFLDDEYFTTMHENVALLPIMEGERQEKLMKETLSSKTSFSTLTSNELARPLKQAKIISNSCKNFSGTLSNPRSSSSSPPQALHSLGNAGSPPAKDLQSLFGKHDYGGSVNKTVYNKQLNFEGFFNKNKSGASKGESQQGTKRDRQAVTGIRTPAHAQDHIMAERRRREKLSQRFIALSAIVPGLKKMDKASVLGDAIKYLKQLQERVNLLEEQTKKRIVESVVFVNKSQLAAGNDTDANPDVLANESLPEIEARVSDKCVLIRIHCEKNKGAVPQVLTEIEKLHLSIVNSTTLPFGNHATDITVVAQMENEFSMTVKELVKELRSALLKVMG